MPFEEIRHELSGMATCYATLVAAQIRRLTMTDLNVLQDTKANLKASYSVTIEVGNLVTVWLINIADPKDRVQINIANLDTEAINNFLDRVNAAV